MEFSFLPRSERWRVMRRAAHESLSEAAIKDYSKVLIEETRLLVEGLLDCPDITLSRHVHRVAASIAWRCLFGQQAILLHGSDPTHRIEELAGEMTRAMLPGGSLVDICPILKPVIQQFPFLRRHADRWFEELSSCFQNAYSDEETSGHTSASGILKTMELSSLDPLSGAWMMGSLFFAAEDTTACALLWFFCAMLLYPETASAARQQLAQVVADRPPSFADYHSLPQIEAMEFEYSGYVIPKGAIILANIYAIARDPELYTNGDRFDPSRFIDENGHIKQPKRDSKDDYLCFGHGRRICLGKDFATNSLWITFAYLLWAFDFRKPVGPDGEEEVAPAELGFHDKGVTVEPVPFSIRVVPRFPDLVDRLNGPRAEE
ncbi:cytochrome P450 [Dacryopinax primogenitus]|uniref:Cytochrome P450 n=1 Tax=Dacryopinax primogenitus (strain DJM 731) TaxID=1858805 RepID=M5FWH3_DACPD|nr:cytochrome P450 [Dacryopinax primogenitus]EJU00719.1 cytochrome P450 [Dacryopinax primogenitus]